MNRWALAGLLLTLWSTPAGAQEPLGSPVPGPEHAEVLVGEVTVRALEEGRVAVILNQFDAQEPDATAERVFILQSGDPAPEELPIVLGAARVVFKEDRLLVVSLEEPRAVALFLSEVDRDAVETAVGAMLAERYGSGGTDAVLFHTGYGLARLWGRFELPIDSWPPRRPADL